MLSYIVFQLLKLNIINDPSALVASGVGDIIIIAIVAACIIASIEAFKK